MVGLLIVASGVAGAAYLTAHFRANSRAVDKALMPGTNLTIDKPDGWVQRDLNQAPQFAKSFLADPAGTVPGGVLFEKNGASLFVIHAPNSAGIKQLPAFPDSIAQLTVTAQREVDHILGPGRELIARSNLDDQVVMAHATVIVTSDRIIAVGLLAPHELTAAELTDVGTVLDSLRVAPTQK